MDRRRFLRQLGSVSVVLAGGRVFSADAAGFDDILRKKVALRFAVASDGHYGQPGTAFESFYDVCVRQINGYHAREPFAFTMINGDIIHDDPKFFEPAKKALDGLQMKYYVSQGNHDHCSREQWQQVWGMPVNHAFSIGNSGFIIATSSDEKGTYLCPDLDWMEAALNRYRSKSAVFIFIHINPMGQTANAVTCAKLSDLLSRYRNVRAVFNGHDHDQDGIKMHGNIPFIFDAHFGGSWGTTYKGFRVVELLNDQSLVTFVMNPDQVINKATLNAQNIIL